MKLIKQSNRTKRGAALVEYGLIVAGVALVAAAAVSIFGKKTGDMIGAAAAILPGANEEDNGAITSGRLIETTAATEGDGTVSIDANAIMDNTGEARLGDNLNLDLSDLVYDPTLDDGE